MDRFDQGSPEFRGDRPDPGPRTGAEVARCPRMLAAGRFCAVCAGRGAGACPHRRPERRRRVAWGLLLCAMPALSAGIIMEDGLLIAAGLVLVGVAAHFFETS
ncbi:hypothetical protein [Streptomyces zingiberis]|uniref:DUF3040 domain-containing protein n=1 Tax=Streptomyces zingiberis TaxID=2053010 RepID=A0ABX1BN01_9ACTN|nr:hypothetical protein [Streptomyces zingiberis]NJP99116.1 hypothetical protein [Streptomyces zingiberis]